MVADNDGDPLNEGEMVCDSLMNNDGILRGNKVIRLVPGQSVPKLNIGDAIGITGEESERVSAAFLAEIEREFL